MMPVDLALHGRYDLGLVALSVVIAILASRAALDLAGRVTAAQGGARALWLAGGAFAMGLGIWSMHYVGMLAFHVFCSYGSLECPLRQQDAERGRG